MDKFLATISAFTANHESANFIMDKDGIGIRATDIQTVSLTDVMLPSNLFIEYEIDQKLEFSVKLEEFLKYLKRANKDDTITLSTDKDLIIQINGRYNKRFSMSVNPFDEKAARFPHIELTNKIKTNIDVFKEVCEDIKLVSSFIKLDVKDKKLSINGEDRGYNRGATLEFFMSEKPVIELVSGTEANAKYNIALFEKVISALKAQVTDLTASFDTEKPMLFELELPHYATIRHFVAPYITD